MRRALAARRARRAPKRARPQTWRSCGHARWRRKSTHSKRQGTSPSRQQRRCVGCARSLASAAPPLAGRCVEFASLWQLCNALCALTPSGLRHAASICASHSREDIVRGTFLQAKTEDAAGQAPAASLAEPSAANGQDKAGASNVKEEAGDAAADGHAAQAEPRTASARTTKDSEGRENGNERSRCDTLPPLTFYRALSTHPACSGRRTKQATASLARDAETRERKHAGQRKRRTAKRRHEATETPAHASAPATQWRRVQIRRRTIRRKRRSTLR